MTTRHAMSPDEKRALAWQIIHEEERRYMEAFSCTWGDDCRNPCEGQWDGIPICDFHYQENERRESVRAR